MSINQEALVRRFSALFGDVCWGDLSCQFGLVDAAPPADTIGNVNVIPFIGDQCLMMRLGDGTVGMPGGTLEPGEDYWTAITRELMEEMGAGLLTFEPLGTWHCHSSSSGPYRPHLPHPDFNRFVGYGDVEIIGVPTIPEGGEDVVAVDLVSVEEAHERFVEMNRPELGQAYLLAAAMRSEKGIGKPVPSMT